MTSRRDERASAALDDYEKDRLHAHTVERSRRNAPPVRMARHRSRPSTSPT
ncbi:hypothetical protein [Brachybacterium sacelli]|uniref:hypothetical protein n=1 Tax=Brachybacterium sacelli TaxID=173364 RepID=UPI00362309C0